MFVTQYGNFDGNSWESMFQIIFKRKHMSAGYQRVKASPGDFGIEGFTKDGQTFQCYCPDMNVDNKSLYDKQRTKITDDINKLKTNQKELLEILGGVKLKYWVLVTPYIAHRDLINHCNTKRDLVKSWELPFIDDGTFHVLVHEGDDYAIEIGEYFNHAGKKFAITPRSEDSTPDKLVEWQKTKIDLIANALEKNEVRVKSLANIRNTSQKVNELTDHTARYYLNGESILRVWQSSQPENHQRFIELVASVEEELKERCLLNAVEPNQFVKEVSEYIERKLKNSFQYLDESTVVRLKNYCVSSWILRCPLYFETENNEI